MMSNVDYHKYDDNDEEDGYDDCTGHDCDSFIIYYEDHAYFMMVVC
jgi:hypothetical protein